MNIGIVGGTFNPVHNGHIAIALYSLERIPLDYIYLVPSSNPPHKNYSSLASFSHRVEMIKLAINNYPRLLCSELDYTGNDKSYSKYLIQRFKQQLPEAVLYFIIGTDNIPMLHTWFDYEWILNNVKIVAVNRKTAGKYRNLPWSDMISFLDMPPVDISSSELRKMIARGGSINASIPPAVSEYIFNKKLYTQEANL